MPAASDRLSDARVARYDPCMADLNRMAHRLVRDATEPAEAPTLAQVSGRKGGQKGGAARAKKLSPEKRAEIARNAAKARWSQNA
jgi:hypothetical protein